MANKKIKIKQLVTNRIRVTKNGKLLRRQAFKRHLNAGKSKKRLRKLSKMVLVKEVFAKKLRKYLGTKLK
ncbi:MAG: 50S ribosomal protein L35 [Candidatus Woesebacteria bacterium GW2011_GWA1_33_30]|uniref:Large ribosomal subunit protein bL35 n=1 Tax=Candidatus Woesebacteria bacterium GW2011_GWA2_33_28 TaxID=1618561 RepID=A0A0G0CA99_9BACT|nr:MAG: 50S ribosomal protein L35 [Candidatus Woesebacteria bacterium GW2011_GWA2_33_28]KKP48898.1 MAG: 50S ribosomal protein L35 [Candidatus Woesebacteria bacterium GW2011_GWA1_33_30]KKP50171.1 MAG: 50S ribosomal protein L35 [Microgenomates group bacterium GW2011_GWC1_33_32]KKP51941.1 MAG: 50S ribosomal protein L35 [Candidatus Woesebacteria bacterium GW2011_GWB1_33_38]KKP58271.1 MAG: 50S ribosomal protein L35 [Microgenomates group bacterium GW2011_GWD1_33_9]